MNDINVTPAVPVTPHCDRLAESYEAIEAIRGFLEYVRGEGLVLVRRDTLKVMQSQASRWASIVSGYSRVGEEQEFAKVLPVDTDPLIDEYFGIDPKALETERRALLAHARSLGS